MWATGDAGPPAVNTSATGTRTASPWEPRSLRLILDPPPTLPGGICWTASGSSWKSRDTNIIVKFLGTLNEKWVEHITFSPSRLFVWLERQRPSLKEQQNNYWGHVSLSVKVGHSFYWSCLRRLGKHRGWGGRVTHSQWELKKKKPHSDEETFCSSYFVNNANKQECCAVRPYLTLTSDLPVLHPVTFTCLFSKLPLWHSPGSQVSFQNT